MKKLHDLFRTSSLLIADTHIPRLQRLKSMAVEIGFNESMIFTANSGEDAVTQSLEKDIAFAIVDESVGYNSLSRLRVHFEDREVRDPNTLMFFISEVASKGVVGRMAEEGVTDFIFRPYRKENFKSLFITAVEKKSNPSAWLEKVRQGRLQLNEGKVTEALESFTLALSITGASAAVVHYYLGVASIANENFEAALKHFESGLSANPIHYRCLQGIYELRMLQGRPEEAYKALKRVSEQYPENAERLMQLLRMAVEHSHLRDVERLDQVYDLMELKTEKLKKYFAAAHAVLGRSLCVQKIREPALKALSRAIELSNKGEYFIAYAIESLEKYDFKSDAEDFRRKYGSPSAQASTKKAA